MAYREPGVYTEIINARPLSGATPNLIPLIIGEGPAYFDFPGTPVTRSSSGDTDTLPASLVTAITRIYTVSGGVQTTITPSGNYTLTNPNIISWSASAPNKPTASSTYYVDYEARPEASQYLPAYVTSFDQLATAYGGQLMKTTSGGAVTSLNPVGLGAYLALEAGAQGVYVLQVEPANKTTYAVAIATDITATLDKASAIEDAYFLVPMTEDSTAVGAVVTHVNTMSTTLERKERVCFISKNISAPAATTGIFSSGEITAAINALSSMNDQRVRVPFVTKVTKVLSDAVSHELTGCYVCAALGGLAAVVPVAGALTRQKLFNFPILKNVTTLTRADKNSLAQVGYIILEQAGGSGSPVTIRHGVTTNMTSTATKEHSVVTSCDFTAKYLRNSLEGYIGLYNIDAFLVTKMSGTITGCKNYLVRNSILKDLKTLQIAQDADNPDSMLISVSAAPLYPCNYIDIDILVE